jgi:hypothetical protein
LPVVAEGVDIPPEVAPGRDRLVEPRLAITAAAASCPDIAAIGTPGPGCTLPPARNRPGTGLAAGDLANAEFQPCVAWPYKAPPVLGKRRWKSSGVVRTDSWACGCKARPHRRMREKVW